MITWLSVTLVVVSALAVGAVVHLVVPDVSFAAGVALGAVVSPTDAVAATAIGKRLGLPHRLMTVLEGESLFNDASALVVLRTALLAITAGFSLGDAVLDFVRAVALAVLIGCVVGHSTVWLRSKLDDPVLMTAVSFIVPFLAFLPAEEAEASGRRGRRRRGPGHRAPRRPHLHRPRAPHRAHELADAPVPRRERRLPPDGPPARVPPARPRRLVQQPARGAGDRRPGPRRAARPADRLRRRPGARSSGASRPRLDAMRRAAHADQRPASTRCRRRAAPRVESERGQHRMSQFRRRIQRGRADVDYQESEPVTARGGAVAVVGRHARRGHARRRPHDRPGGRRAHPADHGRVRRRGRLAPPLRRHAAAADPHARRLGGRPGPAA